MHFHLPKPLHGWREFAGEVGIIVIGVLIALGAEQLLENWHWRQRIDESDKALALELGELVGQAVVRVDESPCVEQRLDWLATVVDAAAASKRLPAIGRLAAAKILHLAERRLAEHGERRHRQSSGP